MKVRITYLQMIPKKRAHVTYCKDIKCKTQAKAHTLFAWGETDLATAPFGGVGEEGGNSSKYASYELPNCAA